MDIMNLIKVQAMRTPPTETNYAALTTLIKKVFSAENEENTGHQLIRIENWDFSYMAVVFSAHPNIRSAFNELYNDAIAASNNHDARIPITPRQREAVKAIRDLVGTDPKKIENFLRMIEDANEALKEEDKQKAEQERLHQQPGPSKPHGGRKLTHFEHDSINTLRENGVVYDANASQSIDAIVHTLRAQVNKQSERIAS